MSKYRTMNSYGKVIRIALLALIIGFLFVLGGFLGTTGTYPFADEFGVRASTLKMRLRIAHDRLVKKVMFSGLRSAFGLFLEGAGFADSSVIYSGLHVIGERRYDLSKYFGEYYKNEGRAPGYVQIISTRYLLLAEARGELYSFNKGTREIVAVPADLKGLLAGQHYPKNYFGIRDLYFDETANNLYVSYYALGSEGCYSMALARAKTPVGFVNEPMKANLAFEKFFDSGHCSQNAIKNMLASGGRIDRFDNKLLFTIGRYTPDKLDEAAGSEDDFLGSVIAISADGQYETLSVGHRNPEGLTVFGGRIFVSEQGPMGGDEINEIIKGKNYGWPYVSYGLSYDKLDAYKMPHSPEYEEPSFYFTPSITVSEIRFYEGLEFPRWKDSLLASSLKEESLIRLYYDQLHNRFISAERIFIGHRIRDLDVDNWSGHIWLFTDDCQLIELFSISEDPHCNSTEAIHCQ